MRSPSLRQTQQPAPGVTTAVFQKPDRAIRPLGNSPDPRPHSDPLCFLRLVAVEYHTHNALGRQAGN